MVVTMEGLFQPTHLIFILLLLLIFFGGKRLPDPPAFLGHRGKHGRRFPPGMGPRIRCYFPEPEYTQGDDMAGENKLFNTKHWLKYLAVILIGNLLYFGLMPYLPAGARHRSFHVDAGTLVDLWFCLVVYGIFELVEFLWNRAKRR